MKHWNCSNKRLAGAPHRTDLMFMLAQLYMRKEDFKAARQLIDKVIAEARRRHTPARAGIADPDSLRWSSRWRESARTKRSVGIARMAQRLAGLPSEGAVRLVREPYRSGSLLRESLESLPTGETQTQGTLTRIDCDAKGITFVVKVDDRLLKLNTDAFEHAEHRELQ